MRTLTDPNADAWGSADYTCTNPSVPEGTVSRAIIAGIWVTFFQRVPAIIVGTGTEKSAGAARSLVDWAQIPVSSKRKIASENLVRLLGVDPPEHCPPPTPGAFPTVDCWSTAGWLAGWL